MFYHARHYVAPIRFGHRPLATVKKRNLPTFDSETFFRNLQVHQERLAQATASHSDWNLPWDTELWDVMHPRSSRTTTSSHDDLAIENADRTVLQSTMPIDSPECSSPEDPTSDSFATDIDQRTVLDRLEHAVRRAKKGYHTQVFGTLSKDICRLLPALPPARLVFVLTTLSTVRSKDCINVFMTAEPHVMKLADHMTTSQITAVLSAYSRMELLWGIHSEDAELWVEAAPSGSDVPKKTFNSTMVHTMPELTYYHSSLRIRSALRTHHATATRRGRLFVHRLLSAYLAVYAQERHRMTYEDAVMFLFGLLAQRPFLTRRCLATAADRRWTRMSGKYFNSVHQAPQSAEHRFLECLLIATLAVTDHMVASLELDSGHSPRPHTSSTGIEAERCRHLDAVTVFLLSRLFSHVESGTHVEPVASQQAAPSPRTDSSLPETEGCSNGASRVLPDKETTITDAFSRIFHVSPAESDGYSGLAPSRSPPYAERLRRAILRRVGDVVNEAISESSTQRLPLGHLILLDLALQQLAVSVRTLRSLRERFVCECPCRPSRWSLHCASILTILLRRQQKAFNLLMRSHRYVDVRGLWAYNPQSALLRFAFCALLSATNGSTCCCVALRRFPVPCLNGNEIP